MERDIHNLLFIEAGEYNKNLYGTSLDAVHRVIESVRFVFLQNSNEVDILSFLRTIFSGQKLCFGRQWSRSETFVKRKYFSNCDFYPTSRFAMGFVCGENFIEFD